MILAFIVGLIVLLTVSTWHEYKRHTLAEEVKRILENSWAFVWVDQDLYEISFRFKPNEKV